MHWDWLGWFVSYEPVAVWLEAIATFLWNAKILIPVEFHMEKLGMRKFDLVPLVEL
jgi:hypothetical protein